MAPFGLGHKIGDGVRGEALVMHSAAGQDFGGEYFQAGSFSRWLSSVSLLVRVPGQAQYELAPRMWMKRARYPVAGTTRR